MNLMHHASPARTLWKNLLVAAGAFALAAAPALAAEPWDDDYEALLKKYVVFEGGKGGVKYNDWKASNEDMAALTKITDAIAKNGPSATDDPTRFAYYMNAYNANVLRLILETYPVESVKGIPGFFTAQNITVDGKKMSLDELEKGILAGFKDPRYHFAINCGAKSCPPLLPMPLKTDVLYEQLTDLTTVFIQKNPEGIKYEDDAKQGDYSSLFNWYGDQFKAASPDGTVIGFINKFRQTNIPGDVVFVELPYDWNLNQKM